MVLRFIGRVILVPLAFVLAGAAASALLISVGLERATQAVAGRDVTPDSIDDIFELIRQGRLLLSGLTLVPALGLVIVGEVARIRSFIYYVVGGGAALAAIPFVARVGGGAESLLPAASVWPIFATAGFAGGFVYWLVAGRSA